MGFNTTNQDNTPVLFTNSAAMKVYELIKEEDNPQLNLRVFITGGGCSGFQYGLKFDDEINEDDTIIEKKISKDNGENGGNGDAGGTQVRLLIDAMSFQYLSGAKIDYLDDIEGGRFVITNPKAQTTCGCGSSFSA
jgi:iron-sulfur cluster insertion protein